MGFNYTGSQFNQVTLKLMSLREELKSIPWYHLIKRSRLKDIIYQLEIAAIVIGIEQAIDDLEKAGIVTRI